MENNETPLNEKNQDGAFKGLVKKETAVRIIAVIGIAGIGLIFLSSMLGKKSSGTQTDNSLTSVSVVEDASSYREMLCEELGNMIASIEGAGRTKVMVTIDGTTRKLYATDNDIQKKENLQKNSSAENEDRQNSEKRSCIVIRSGNGTEQALVVGELMPNIKGVLVVCDGGGSNEISDRIKKAVSAALNIPESHISIVKMSS